jgi:hypothetical protein
MIFMVGEHRLREKVELEFGPDRAVHRGERVVLGDAEDVAVSGPEDLQWRSNDRAGSEATVQRRRDLRLNECGDRADHGVPSRE